MFDRQDRSERNGVRRLAQWLSTGPEVPATPWGVVAWWELRRIPFNVIVGAYGVVAILVFFWAIGTSGHLEPGEDAVEPIALLAAPFVINALYTLGWLLEVPVRLAKPSLSRQFGVRLLGLGLVFGLGLITLPAGIWLGVRALQVLGMVK